MAALAEIPLDELENTSARRIEIRQAIKIIMDEMSYDVSCGDLSPSKIQANKLELYFKQSKLDFYLPRNNLDFLNFFGELSYPKYKTLPESYPLFKNHSDKKDDQLNRADKIVRQMIRNQTRTIYFMDGHGRFLYCFLQKVFELDPENINNYQIHLFDSSEHATKWHQLLLNNINTIECLTIDAYQVLINQRTTRSYVYLNFCSISTFIKMNSIRKETGTEDGSV